jgi:hypothetical protein
VQERRQLDEGANEEERRPTQDDETVTTRFHVIANNDQSDVDLGACEDVPSQETTIDCAFVEDEPPPAPANTVRMSIERTVAIILQILSMIAVSDLSELSTTTAATHKIRILQGTKPIKQKERRVAFQFRDELDQMINDLSRAGKIQPSYSAWASPLRLLGKKDGTLRMAIAYQLLNNVTEKVAYPLPFINDIFTRLARA